MAKPMTTTIHVHNKVERPTSNVVLMFLQPVPVLENFEFSAWNVLNPGPGTHQSVDLITSFAASIAEWRSTRNAYTDPVALPLGESLTITNQNGQSPIITNHVNEKLTPAQVGVYNDAITPPTDLSITWYVSGKKVVETNNADVTVLRPSYTSTFELKQSVYLMFGQRPTITQTYTVQTFSRTVEIAVPNGAPDVWVEAYTDEQGRDTFRQVDQNEFRSLVERGETERRRNRRYAMTLLENATLRGVRDQGAIVRRDISDVSVLPMAGPPLLNGNGIGHLELDGPNLVRLWCGIFPAGGELPKVNQSYVITGRYDDTHLPFKYTLRCSAAGSPTSYFQPQVPALTSVENHLIGVGAGTAAAN